MENEQIATLFDEMGDLLELLDANEFRIRSYRNAARAIRDASEPMREKVEKGQDLTEIANIGEGAAGKIREIVERGTCKRLEDLRERVPRELTELMKIPHLGPRKAMQVHKELGVDSLQDLKNACEQKKVRRLEGLGARMEEKLLGGLATVEKVSGRTLYAEAAEYVALLGDILSGTEGVQQFQTAGSFRRRKETVGDLDILVRSTDRNATADALAAREEIAEVLSRGEERVSVRLQNGLQVDFRFFDKPSWGAALHYFTGSKAHNIALRKRCVERGWKLNEYGLFKDDKRLAGATEASVYSRLQLPWIPPELREDRGELEAAETDDLPDLIEPDDIRGDLHMHTTETDGNNTIRELADAAKERGYDYIAVTDHSQRVSVAQGMDDKRCRKHAEAVRREGGKIKGIRLLAGVEVDILKSGKLDLQAKTLADLDWVVASVHSYFDLSETKMTARLLAAIESGVIHALGHPTGRMIGKREPVAFDREAVFEACREHDVCLEIDSQPDRLDLSDVDAREARDAGAVFAVVTDAHKAESLRFVDYGVHVARRAWIEPAQVVNTWTNRKLKKWCARSGG